MLPFALQAEPWDDSCVGQQALTAEYGGAKAESCCQGFQGGQLLIVWWGQIGFCKILQAPWGILFIFYMIQETDDGVFQMANHDKLLKQT